MSYIENITDDIKFRLEYIDTELQSAFKILNEEPEEITNADIEEVREILEEVVG